MILNTAKAALLEEETRLRIYLRPDSTVREGIEVQYQADELDNITSLQQREHAVGDILRATNKLARVGAAIKRIADNSFGVCVECENPIPERRLLALPWAERCVPCQERLDIIGSENPAQSLENADEANS